MAAQIAALGAVAACGSAASAEPTRVGALPSASGVFAGVGHDQTLASGMGLHDVGRKVAAYPDDRLCVPPRIDGLYAAGARG